MVCLASPLFAAPAPLPAPEYEVLSALLAHGLAGDTRLAVLADRTSGAAAGLGEDPTPAATRAARLGTTEALLAEWERVNQQTFQLEKKIGLKVPYTLLADFERSTFFQGDDPETGWSRFYRRFAESDGIIRVSRPALDPTGTQALVYLEFQCGAECGSGRMVNLQRAPGQGWRVTGGELLWVAAPAATPPVAPPPAQSTPRKSPASMPVAPGSDAANPMMVMPGTRP